MALNSHGRLQDHWHEVVEEEEVDEDLPFTLLEISRERMSVWAKDVEAAKKYGYRPIPPPVEILNYPDLFERAWGWDTFFRCILPYALSCKIYKRYLEDYYIRNKREANDEGDHGNRLAALAHSCTKMEEHLMFMWNHHCHVDLTTDKMIRQMSEDITMRAHEMAGVLESEFPAAAVSFECITKEAELMCRWLLSGAPSAIHFVTMSNDIRRCALSFMTYKDHDYVPAAAAAMMGIMKEAKLMCESLMKRHEEDINQKILDTHSNRDHALSVMLDICDEFSVVRKPNGDIDMTYPENVGKEEMDEINENEDGSNGQNSTELARIEPEEWKGISGNKNTKEQTRKNLEGWNQVKDGIEKQVYLEGSNNTEDVISKEGLEKLEIKLSPLGGKAENVNKDERDEINDTEGGICNGEGRNNVQHDIPRTKLGVFLGTKLSPLGGKAGENAELAQKKWKAGCFAWWKPGRVNGAAAI